MKSIRQRIFSIYLIVYCGLILPRPAFWLFWLTGDYVIPIRLHG